MADTEPTADHSADYSADRSADPSAGRSADLSADRAAGTTLMLAGRPRKRFTLIEANRTLPLVGRIAADVVRTHAQARTLHNQLTRKMPRDRRVELNDALDIIVSKLEGYVDELNEVGVEITDYQAGLLDFVSVHQGRDVYLCWKLGDERIGHWHEIDASFTARQPVSILQQ